MRNTYFKSGDHNAICDRCGFKFKASELQKTWDGFYVCKEDFEVRHIADFIKAPKPASPLPWIRPEPTDGDASPTYISESTGIQETDIPEVTPGNAGEL